LLKYCTKSRQWSHECYCQYGQNRGRPPNPIPNPISNPKSYPNPDPNPITNPNPKPYPNPIPNPKPNPKCYRNRVRWSPTVLPSVCRAGKSTITEQR